MGEAAGRGVQNVLAFDEQMAGRQEREFLTGQQQRQQSIENQRAERQEGRQEEQLRMQREEMRAARLSTNLRLQLDLGAFPDKQVLTDAGLNLDDKAYEKSRELFDKNLRDKNNLSTLQIMKELGATFRPLDEAYLTDPNRETPFARVAMDLNGDGKPENVGAFLADPDQPLAKAVEFTSPISSKKYTIPAGTPKGMVQGIRDEIVNFEFQADLVKLQNRLRDKPEDARQIGIATVFAMAADPAFRDSEGRPDTRLIAEAALRQVGRMGLASPTTGQGVAEGVRLLGVMRAEATPTGRDATSPGQPLVGHGAFIIEGFTQEQQSAYLQSNNPIAVLIGKRSSLDPQTGKYVLRLDEAITDPADAAALNEFLRTVPGLKLTPLPPR